MTTSAIARAFSSAAAIAVALFAFACSEGTAPRLIVSSITITPSTHQLNVGERVTLTAALRDQHGNHVDPSGRTISWRSDQPLIVSVTSAGELQAHAVGVAHITAASEQAEGVATITVVQPVAPVALVDVVPSAVELSEGASAQLTAIPRDASGIALDNRTVLWESANTTVAVVTQDGTIVARNAGTVEIRATSEGVIGRAQVTVRAVPVASIALNTHTVHLQIGDVTTLSATLRDANGNELTGRSVQWSTSEPAVATVSNDGRVTAHGGGQAVITAISEGQHDEATVIVAPGNDPSADLLFDQWEGVSYSGGSTLMHTDVVRLDPRYATATAQMVWGQHGTWDASASPDGSRIAIVAADGGHTSVYVIVPGGVSMLKIAGGPLSADQPAWSPDGTQIAFRLHANYAPARIWVANADGTGAHAITDGLDGEQSHPTWSSRQADGSYRIAFSRSTRGNDGYMHAQIWSVRADGADAQAVTTDPIAYDDEPSWSPDGSTIVFVRTGGEYDHQLLMVSAAGGAIRPLFAVEPDGAQAAPAWSPDGSLIAFVSSHEIDAASYRKQIYTVRPDGTGLTRRSHVDADQENPAWIARLPLGSAARASNR